MSISNHRTTSAFLRYGIRHESAQRAALEKVDALLRELETAPKVRPIANEKS
jgi:hypothetical protein